MGQLNWLVDWVWTRIRGYPPSSLASMRLGNEGRSQNALMVQFFTWNCRHPTLSWWKHFESEVPQLAEMGVTQVWLPPPNKAMTKHGQGYDAYDLWDLGEFSQKGNIATRWGTKDELIQAIATAKAHGIDVLIDAVLNHKLGADRTEVFHAVPVDPKNRLRDLTVPREIEGWTAFDFSGRDGKYSSLKWTQEHFTGLDWDNRARLNGVYRIVGGQHQGWSRFVDGEFANYDYLLGVDIDHRHPEVRQDLLAWGKWVLETTGAVGFRLDAIKHMDRFFLVDFLKYVREATGRGDLFSVAEYWSGDVRNIRPYIYAFQGLVSFFDVPLHYNFHKASKWGPFYDLRTVLNNTILQFRPGDAVTFVDNHECQIGQTLESWVGRNFKLQAYALILLRGEGHPCVFYGDIYPNDECYDEYIAQGVRRLMNARKRFAYGERIDYFQNRNCIGFVRTGDDAHEGCAVIVSNAVESAGTKGIQHMVRMNVGAGIGGSSFTSSMDPELPEYVDIAPDGWGVFTCPPGKVQVWVKSDTSPARRAAL
ncbi:glycoside hydrolase family 13 protein [Laetiporus sulphureus 93-53]|uniref:Glycoside hydrolase family 13 protein n=1 Tax=Laetiporus sulphureus 93-53 TaxID=1314785 RepID=A0A165BD45_9APHY|nr:glycoside hydrolase family 13 protein [Laetiporus sulphureus 93-53]KZT00780.1 glycoside hydrolase family 13 protein [Laetiporus sulphureus 93-53]